MTLTTGWLALEERWAATLIEAFAPPDTDTAGEPGSVSGPPGPSRVGGSAAPSGAANAHAVRLVPRPGEVDWAAAYRTLLARATPLARLGLRFALLVAVTGPLHCWRRFALAPALPLRERTRLMRDLLASRSYLVRELSLLLKICAAFAMFRAPGLRARSGYDGDASAAHALPPRGGAAAPGHRDHGPRAATRPSGQRPRMRLPIAGSAEPPADVGTAAPPPATTTHPAHEGEAA